MNIGSVIKKYRKVSGFTQEEMANRLGVTTPAVNKWENGVPKQKDIKEQPVFTCLQRKEYCY